MLHVYVDASTRASGTFCVAAVAFGPARARRAEREWRRLCGDRVFHMADLHARRGDFKGWSSEQAGGLCRAAVALVNRYASYRAAVSCNLGDAARLLPSGHVIPELAPLRDASSEAYPACFQMLMVALTKMVEARRATPDRMAYFLERGDRHSGYALSFLDGMPESAKDLYQYGFRRVVPKGSARLLEAADLLAWEWGKHVDRLADGLNSRPSLDALAGGPVGPVDYVLRDGFLARHADTEKLERWVTRVRQEVLVALDEWNQRDGG